MLEGWTKVKRWDSIMTDEMVMEILREADVYVPPEGMEAVMFVGADYTLSLGGTTAGATDHMAALLGDEPREFDDGYCAAIGYAPIGWVESLPEFTGF
jgi:hypothetical protein